MNIPTYSHPQDPDYNDPLNNIVPLSDKSLPDDEYESYDETPDGWSDDPFYNEIIDNWFDASE